LNLKFRVRAARWRYGGLNWTYDGWTEKPLPSNGRIFLYAHALGYEPLMRGIIFLGLMFLAPASHAAVPVSPDKPIARIDSLIATARGGQIHIQARGAVTSGGWKYATLKAMKPSLPADAHTIVLAFVAQPPPSNQAVIPGLLPVAATIALKTRKGMISVRVLSAANEITTQILK
jgi:hypothetical protein